MPLTRSTLPASKIHFVLSNTRRQLALEYLAKRDGVATLRDLSEEVAAAETGQSPPPRNVRETVYVSLHQTHLPTLHDLGLIEYDRDRKVITWLAASRDVQYYMEVVTKYGITWDEFYRYLGVIGLLVVIASLASVPGVDLLDPLLWASGFLLAFALSTTVQLWRGYRVPLRRRFGRS